MSSFPRGFPKEPSPPLQLPLFGAADAAGFIGAGAAQIGLEDRSFQGTARTSRTRLLELAPLFWPAPRARLEPLALARELGPVAIPLEPLDTRMRVSSKRRAEGFGITR